MTATVFRLIAILLTSISSYAFAAAPPHSIIFRLDGDAAKAIGADSATGTMPWDFTELDIAVEPAHPESKEKNSGEYQAAGQASKAGPAGHFLLQELLNKSGVWQLRRVFPHHNRPEEKFHHSGEEMVDLSLLYEVLIAPEEDPELLIQRLLVSGLVEWAEQRVIPELLDAGWHDANGELIMHQAFVPSDSLLDSLYYLYNIDAYAAWGIQQGQPGVFIAIVDTGNDFFHPDLMESVMYNYADPVNGEDSDNDGYIDNFYGWDLGENNNFPQFNRHGHGVHVSGTAAATTNNGIGIAGTGCHSRYLPVKIDDTFGRLTMAYEGIVYAADQGAAVINCSWGSYRGGGMFGNDIVRYASLNRDALVVAGAGNEANGLPFYPASYDHVLGVAATDSLDMVWERSSYGIYVGLSAPGVRVLSTWPDNQYIYSSGTSMSAPIVSGAAALVRSQFPQLSARQTAARLMATADNIDQVEGNEGHKQLLGSGRLNMYRALTDPFYPYMRIFSQANTTDDFGAMQAGHTHPIAMTFQNLFGKAEQLTARLSTLSPYVSITQPWSAPGVCDSMETVNNHGDPFLIQLHEDIPANHVAEFFVHFFEHDTIAAGRDAFSVTLNRDYLNIEAGTLLTTVTSHGNIGYNYPNFHQGHGFGIDRAPTRLVCAGLLYGNSPNNVVDNIYGTEKNSFSQAFVIQEQASFVDNPEFSDIETIASFSDGVDGRSAYGIEVCHRNWFWNQQEGSTFMITEYLLINKSDSTINDLRAGFFVDWAMRDPKNMRAAFDADNSLAYAWNDGLLQYSGIQLLSGTLGHHYAFDTDGDRGSISLTEGFPMESKYLALTTSRNEAGSFRGNNDIASMLSMVPASLTPGDTLRLAIALHAAINRESMMAAASRATHIYREITGESPVSTPMPPPLNNEWPQVHAYPNPFRDNITITVNNPQYKNRAENTPALEKHNNIVIEIRDLTGKIHHQETLIAAHGQHNSFTINPGRIPLGVYILFVKWHDTQMPFKIIRYE